MALDHRQQTVVLRCSASDNRAPQDPHDEPVVLVTASSHQALIAFPQLGELLAEAAMRSWQAQRSFHVTVVAGASIG